jgi:dihydropteroate synthase
VPPPPSHLQTLLPDLGQRVLVMGILNVTPDSFSDGGRFDGIEAARLQADALVAEGAALVDIGGESTRPGHRPVSAEEEQARILPVIRDLAARLPVPISIDTYKAATARVALEAGARLVNDVWGLQREPEIAHVAAAHGAPVMVMHNRETIEPEIDIIADMLRFFEKSLDIARKAGIRDADIVLDPGIGLARAGLSISKPCGDCRRSSPWAFPSSSASRENPCSAVFTTPRRSRPTVCSARWRATCWPRPLARPSCACTMSVPMWTRCVSSMP